MTECIEQQLGNYRLIRLLGQGGSADVYLGEHIHLNTQAAIKVLKWQLLGKNIEQFRHEAQTIANIVHPHIVRILDYDLEDDIPFLVMDYAPNGNLRQRFPKGTRLSPISIVPYVGQIASALQYAHDRMLIHRDIKPENMLLGPNDDVLLSDFGLVVAAQSTRSQTRGKIAGTLAYMAPEQIKGKPRLTSDQYSLGIVIYEWLSGDCPFHGPLPEIVAQHLASLPAPLHGRIPDISPALEEVVFTALAKDPRQRFPSVQAFATAFEQASQPSLALVPLSTPAVPISRRTQPLKQDLQSSLSVEDRPIHIYIPVYIPASKSHVPQERSDKLALASAQAFPARMPGRLRLRLLIFSILLAAILIGVGSVFISKPWLGRINRTTTAKANLTDTVRASATVAPTPKPNCSFYTHSYAPFSCKNDSYKL